MLYCSSNGQVHSVPVGGGTVQQVTALPIAVDCFKVFLDVRTRQWWLLASMSVYPSKSPAETAAADAAADSTCRCVTSARWHSPALLCPHYHRLDAWPVFSGVVYDKLMVTALILLLLCFACQSQEPQP